MTWPQSRWRKCTHIRMSLWLDNNQDGENAINQEIGNASKMLNLQYLKSTKICYSVYWFILTYQNVSNWTRSWQHYLILISSSIQNYPYFKSVSYRIKNSKLRENKTELNLGDFTIIIGILFWGNRTCFLPTQ